LFAGVGGIERGFHAAGHSASLLCEIDRSAIAVLEERFPGVTLQADVTRLTSFGNVDVVTAGFPCQDLSQAGRTKGMAGEKSSLISYVFKLLTKHPVEWLVLENVPFMLQLSRGHALEFVVRSLEQLRYKWAYRVINTQAFGIPHRRDRVYLVASPTNDPRDVLFWGNEEPPIVDPDEIDQAFGFYWTEGNRGLGWAINAIPTLKGGSSIGIASPPAIWLP
jgi:DNA (cytosine-5)-methyltransferase 1